MKKIESIIEIAVVKSAGIAVIFIIAAAVCFFTFYPASAAGLDINTASFEALIELEGVGEVTAAKIIKYRREKKGFKTVYDLLKVDGMTGEIFEKIKDDIYSGPAPDAVEISGEKDGMQPLKTSSPHLPRVKAPNAPADSSRAVSDRIADNDGDGAAGVEDGNDDGYQAVRSGKSGPGENNSEMNDGGSTTDGLLQNINEKENNYSFDEGRRESVVKKNAAVLTGSRSKGTRIGEIKKIEMTPENYYKVIIGLMRLAKYEKAESNISDFIKKFPSDKKIDDMNYLKGACLEEAEKYREALEEYEKVYENSNSELRAIALFRTGVCFDLMGKPADALDKYRKYVSSFPSSSCVKEAEGRIEEMLKAR